jgi:hypothetical protein
MYRSAEPNHDFLVLTPGKEDAVTTEINQVLILSLPQEARTLYQAQRKGG